MPLLIEYFTEVNDEGIASSPVEAKATAICRFIERELEITDEDVMADLYDQLFSIL